MWRLKNKGLHRLWIVLMVFCLGLAAGKTEYGAQPAAAETLFAGTGVGRSAVFAPTSWVYLPMVAHQYYPNPPSISGIYPSTYWHSNTPTKALELEFYPLEAWSGMRLSLAGVFHRFDPSIPPASQPVYSLLSVLWDYGYTPYVNIYSPVSAAAIANGSIDATIHGWAAQYADFANGGQRMAYLAPMQEMNWTGLPYSCDPTNYKLAMERIRSIFAQEGVPEESVRWVFAPNGITGCSGHTMASYYPGNSKIDVIGISAYNYGYHPSNPYPGWSTPTETFAVALQEAYTLAPTKPIFVSQTGTTAYASPGSTDATAKNDWLRDAYSTLPGYANVRAVIYYNANESVDWAFYLSGVLAYTGYRDGVINNYVYLSPSTLKTFDLLNGR